VKPLDYNSSLSPASGLRLRWRGRPRLLPALAVLSLLTLLLALGTWQLHRAEYKRELLARQHRALGQAAQDLRGWDVPLPAWTPVRAWGRTDPDHAMLLANRVYQGRGGYLLLVPLHLEAGGTLLVARGWLPADPDQKVRPQIPRVAPTRPVEGRLSPWPGIGMKLGEPDAGSPFWPKVLTYLDENWVRARLGADVAPLMLLEEGPDTPGLVRDWELLIGNVSVMPPEKHTSYAVQWFSLALTLVVLYLAFHLERSPAPAAGRSQDP